MKNTSGITPKGHRVLIKPEVFDNRTESGIIMATGNEQKRMELAQITGRVVEVGPEAWSDKDTRWAEPGERVIFAKYSGLLYTGADAAEYRLVNDIDIVAVISDQVDKQKL